MATGLQKTHDGFLLNPEDHPRIGVRKKRRSSAGAIAEGDAQNGNENIILPRQGIATPPSTPHRTKKRVRFSDPNPITTTGLTPFLGRSFLSSPPPSRSRGRTTPSSRWNLAVDDSPILCGTLQFAPIRQALDGRVKRRLRRNRLSEEVNTIEAEEKHKRKARMVENELLKEQLRRKDREIQELRNEQDLASQIGGEAGIESLDTSHIDEKIRTREVEIAKLRAELQKRELDAPMHDEPNWALGDGDQLDDDDAFLPNYDEDFNTEMTDIFLSTPTRRSFPSPPATVPNTPSNSASLNGANSELSTTDNERLHLESQLKVLQDELKTLSKTLELTNTTHERLTAKLAPFISETAQTEETESLDAALDAVLTQLALSESAALDSSSRFSALSNELSDLFPSSQSVNPESILQQLHAQFRAARLELEYLTPGENIEGFENSKLLDMLVSRLRVLTNKVKQQDADIDQYHSQEISLRQQLGSRVDAMARLQETLATATSDIARLESDICERNESISKLSHALQGYRDEVSGLETFINRLEVEHAADDAILRDEIESAKRDADAKILDLDLKWDTLEAAAEGREMLMRELERRLSGAVASARALENAFAAIKEENSHLHDTAMQREKTHGDALALWDAKVAELLEENKVQCDTATQREKMHGDALALRDAKVAALLEENNAQRENATQREKAHGDALALRDARVAELLVEIEMSNAALMRAHEDMMNQKRVIRDLEAQLEGEKRRCELVMDSIMGDLSGAKQTIIGYKNGDVAVVGSSSVAIDGAGIPVNGAATSQTVVNPGPGLLFNAGLVRRRSTSMGKGKKRRRYDSGLGFLEEEDEVLENSTSA
jgi:peptidoglycan hydrolase CwlO-like protein